jgi:hypothetical protein
VIVLDPVHEGKVVGSVTAGAGVDNIDYAEDTGLLYVAAQDAAQLTIARVGDSGTPWCGPLSRPLEAHAAWLPVATGVHT